jgi:hypothetical protein
LPAVTAAPLYLIEDQLAALIETAELVSPEQEQEFCAEFQTALTAAVEKRDHVGQFLAHLEQQIDFARFEIDRLRQRKATCERVLARLENHVIETIENLGTDGKGRYRKLEGRTTTFSLRACPPSVEVTDEPAIPPEHKTLTLKLPAVTWERLLDGLDVEQRVAVLGQVKSPEVSVDKRSIKRQSTVVRTSLGRTWPSGSTRCGGADGETSPQSRIPAMDPEPALCGLPHDLCRRGGAYRAARAGVRSHPICRPFLCAEGTTGPGMIHITGLGLGSSPRCIS